MREDIELTDVTLACEDGQPVESHKVILAATSPFFQNLFKMNKHPHPLIYMRWMKSEDLVAIIDFLYCGETTINQENLDDFLTIAVELKLKGLKGGTNETYEERENVDMSKIKTEKCEQKTNNSSMSINLDKTEEVDIIVKYIMDETKLKNKEADTKETFPGEAKSYQATLDDILAFKLKLKDLIVEANDTTDDREIIDDPDNEIQQTNLKLSSEQNSTSISVKYNESEEGNQNTEYAKDESILQNAASNIKVNFTGEVQELDDIIKTMWIMNNIDGQCVYVCKPCGKKDKSHSHMKEHIESKHIQGMSHSCNICEKIFKTRMGLRKHRPRQCNTHLGT